MGLGFSTHSRIFFSSEYFHYKIFIHENCLENWNDKFQVNLSRPGIIDARARRFRNPGLDSKILPSTTAKLQTCWIHGETVLSNHCRSTPLARSLNSWHFNMLLTRCLSDLKRVCSSRKIYQAPSLNSVPTNILQFQCAELGTCISIHGNLEKQAAMCCQSSCGTVRVKSDANY